jgi:hypothetical protein
MAQRVDGDDAADRSNAIRSVHYFLILVQNKIRRVDDFSPLFPKGAYLFRVRWDFKPVGDGILQLQLLDGFLGFIQWIYRKGDDVDVLFSERFKMRLEIGQLPKAVGSPAAAIKNKRRVLSG